MKKYLIIIAGIVAVVAVVVFISQQTAMAPEKSMTGADETRPTEDPLDVTINFYNDWLAAEQSTSTSPQVAGLLKRPVLAPELQATLLTKLETPDSTVNPVLCQVAIPPRIGGKSSYTLDTKAEVHVLARGLDERSSRMAVVTLTAVAGKWVISDIACSSGEMAPEREFSFDREGFLLKSVPPPLDATRWHLVFEENGVMGHTAPLFFNTDSVCVAVDQTSGPCDSTTFTEPSKALVQGEMTEAGVTVKRVTALP